LQLDPICLNGRQRLGELRLSHCRQAIRVRQCHIYLEVAAFAVTHRLFRSFPFSQIHDKRDAFVLPPFEARAAEPHGHATAVLAEELLLERLNGRGRLQLCSLVGCGIDQDVARLDIFVSARSCKPLSAADMATARRKNRPISIGHR
jgi:hypothetical protein